MKNQYADNLNRTINNHNAMISYCYYDHQGRLQTKIEQYSGLQDRYTYLWNDENRLLSVRCNDLLQEEYLYNSKGLRIQQKRTANSGMQHTDGLLYYDKKGRLLQAGKTLYRYDSQGRLVEKQDANGLTRFVYQAGKSKIILPNGHEIVYEYSRNAPCKRWRDGIQSAYYTWQAHNRLDCLYDYDYGLLWNFTYHQKGWPCTAIVSVLHTALPYLQIEDNKKREQLHGMISGCGGVMLLNCGCDHNGTLKVLTNEDGLLFMKSNMDSFGNLHDNGLASAPLGFMNGLVERDTNLLLFGTKFYDPAIANIINISDKNKPITLAGIMAMDDDNWDESEHPRDKAGKFTAKGSGVSGKATIAELLAASNNHMQLAQSGASRANNIINKPDSPNNQLDLTDSLRELLDNYDDSIDFTNEQPTKFTQINSNLAYGLSHLDGYSSHYAGALYQEREIDKPLSALELELLGNVDPGIHQGVIELLRDNKSWHTLPQELRLELLKTWLFLADSDNIEMNVRIIRELEAYIKEHHPNGVPAVQEALSFIPMQVLFATLNPSRAFPIGNGNKLVTAIKFMCDTIFFEGMYYYGETMANTIMP